MCHKYNQYSVNTLSDEIVAETQTGSKSHLDDDFFRYEYQICK